MVGIYLQDKRQLLDLWNRGGWWVRIRRRRQNITREIATGVTIDLITKGSEITTVDDQDLGVLLGQVIKAIEEGGDVEKLSNEYLDDMENI